ncbi:hypothetical protein GCM10023259_027380 [Thermocatellispora tengchongensis]|uniref:hypothetical protein n=1 Tax=Thermocatellispora tengchongensis TaxID=1073253 RepID=UPI0031EEE8F3
MPERAEEFCAAPPAWASAHARLRLGFIRAVNLVWGFDRAEEAVRMMTEAAPAVPASPWRDDLGPTYVAWLDPAHGRGAVGAGLPARRRTPGRARRGAGAARRADW